MRVWSTTLAIAAVLAALAGCAASPKRDAAPAVTTLSTPGELSVRLVPRRGLYYVRASVNGVDAGYFLVDSGSSLTVVDQAFAHRLGLRVSGQSRVEGIGGSPTVPMVRLNAVEVGDVALGAQAASVIDLSTIAKSANLRIGGILGYNTLGQRPFTIDYLAQTLIFHDPAVFKPPENVPGLPLSTSRGLPIVEAEIEGRRCWLMLDCGADRSLMLPASVAEAWPGFLNDKRNVATNSHGVGGRITNVQTSVRSLRVFGLELLTVPVEVEWTSRQSSYNGEVLGRIGTALLSQFRLTFDPRANRIYARWRHGTAVR